MSTEKSKSEQQVYELFIRTTPEALWQAITDGQVTRQYFFGTAIKSSFEPGARLVYEAPDGSPVVSGKVVACERGKSLAHTWKVHYDPALLDEESTVRWSIEPRGSACKLTAVHELERAPKTAANVGVGKDGWSVVLSGLKTLLETGSPLELPLGA
jgi:uncharacterized protein YndB with AHSA1/START domain